MSEEPSPFLYNHYRVLEGVPLKLSDWLPNSQVICFYSPFPRPQYDCKILSVSHCLTEYFRKLGKKIPSQLLM